MYINLHLDVYHVEIHPWPPRMTGEEGEERQEGKEEQEGQGRQGRGSRGANPKP
jgi:hypothetical protein